MTYYADLSSDLPAPYKRKRVIFYQQGLKVYGLLPYILNRKLKAKFYSGSVSFMGGILSAGSFEANWTAIPYQQSPENVTALLDWLYEDRGFEVAIASRQDWDDDIFSANVYCMPPKTWYPMDGAMRQGFLQVIERPERQNIMGLLASPQSRQESK